MVRPHRAALGMREDPCRSEALPASYRARCRAWNGRLDEEARHPDPLAPLVGLLDRALRRLGDRGGADEACRMAAEGWALLDAGRKREAQRLNGTLHYLTRAPHQQGPG